MHGTVILEKLWKLSQERVCMGLMIVWEIIAGSGSWLFLGVVGNWKLLRHFNINSSYYGAAFCVVFCMQHYSVAFSPNAGLPTFTTWNRSVLDLFKQLKEKTWLWFLPIFERKSHENLFHTKTNKRNGKKKKIKFCINILVSLRVIHVVCVIFMKMKINFPEFSFEFACNSQYSKKWFTLLF